MAFLKYSLIRLALFVPLFALFIYLELGWLLAVLCAGMMAFAISFLFYQKQRDAVERGEQVDMDESHAALFLCRPSSSRRRPGDGITSRLSHGPLGRQRAFAPLEPVAQDQAQ